MKFLAFAVVALAVGLSVRVLQTHVQPSAHGLSTGYDAYNVQDRLPSVPFTPNLSTFGDKPEHIVRIGENTYRRDNGEVFAMPGLDGPSLGAPQPSATTVTGFAGRDFRS